MTIDLETPPDPTDPSALTERVPDQADRLRRTRRRRYGAAAAVLLALGVSALSMRSKDDGTSSLVARPPVALDGSAPLPGPQVRLAELVGAGAGWAVTDVGGGGTKQDG